MERNLGLMLMWVLGLFGQVAYLVDLWKPHVPLWVGLGLHLLPLCLVFLGDGVMESGRVRAGRWLRLGGGALVLFYDAGAVWLRLAGHAPPGTAFYLTLMALSVLPAALQVRDGLVGLGFAVPAPRRLPAWLARALGAAETVGWNTITVTLIGLLFVVGAVFLLGRGPRQGRLMALSALSFFLLCAGAGVWGAIERWRSLRPGSGPGSGARRWMSGVVLWGLLLGGVALLGMAVWEEAPWQHRLYAGAIGVIYLIMAVLPAQRLGWVRARVRYVLAEEGLVERRGGAEVVIPYGIIAAAELGEVAHNVALLVWLSDPEGILVRPPDEGRILKRRREMERTRGWYGCDLVLMAVACDEPPGVLLEGLRGRLRGGAMD